MKFLLLTYCLIFSAFANAQQSAFKIYENASQLTTTRYNIQSEQITLNMAFGHSQTINSEIIEKIKSTNIKRVDLVYSDYPKNTSFKNLNIERLNSLQHIAPGLFNSDSVKWSIIKQTDCKTKSQAESLFHGFVFSVNEPKQILEVDYQRNISKVKEAFLALPPEDRKFLSMGNDTLAYDILERNLYNWKNVTIVSDWTASMYPFTTQILRWHISRSGDSNISNFVFFNDGDNKPNAEKKAGETGGIYAIKADTLSQVIELMKMVKENGDGGDLAENDIEALLFAMKNYPESDEYVLVADNRSAIRDTELVKQINKPIRIILGRILMDDIAYIKGQYIRLAVETGGSIHTRFNDYITKNELLQLKDDVLNARRALKARRKAH
ncbi:hypothetical protein [Flexithrix dorotheae]|uniref:hypothetical protein n=1 Tax=Flexithrix dorotheae TaxID=70993 RepID=UPI00035D1356|nr:hypothetical protein [Flexithrix dorotheae]